MKYMNKEDQDFYGPTNDPEVQRGARQYLNKEHITPKMKSLSRQYRTPKEYADAMIDAISESDIQEYFAAGDWQPVAQKLLENVWKNSNKMKIVRK